ncbi:MAG: hypothetical protein WCK65_03700 [Rhodospirillaceae bacterium]
MAKIISLYLNKPDQGADATLSRESRMPLDGGGNGGQIPPMEDAWRDKVNDRLHGLEKEVHGVRGWMTGIAVAIAASVALSLGSLTVSLMTSSKLSDEFRAQRAEMSAQTSAIANSITATRQQAPQVILVPAPGTPRR